MFFQEDELSRAPAKRDFFEPLYSAPSFLNYKEGT